MKSDVLSVKKNKDIDKSIFAGACLSEYFFIVCLKKW